MALALSLVALAAWLLWDWVQHKLRARERELANSLTQDLDVDSIKRLVGEVRLGIRFWSLLYIGVAGQLADAGPGRGLHQAPCRGGALLAALRLA